MKNRLKKIIESIAGFFNRIVDLEAKRVDEFNRHIFGVKQDKGGEF